ncbi:hypothetical protein HRI_004129100 [Hibiscus trionum]|uniref:RING-type E3 ubiquitin transferase n=1 Tax=Hibiscus trionum TaxID=183268 RepID=A0A9W7MJS2_HIBTR|nr:hypothetical protein HRI_004129100 [Hibiscus trionum]
MGACCSSFRIREPEDVSPYQTRISIHTLWGKFIGANSNEQSDAPALNSQVLAPVNSNAASNVIRSDNVVTLAPSVLHFEADAARAGEDKDHDRTKRREDSRVERTEKDSGDKSSGLQCGVRSTAHCIESQSKFSNEKPEAEVACAYGSSEDEDVCPTCLEEYHHENPRIVLQCSHSYHLSCIYEWMERSANCPICGKKMMFDEAA